jgi:hypothetical protein
MRVASERPIHVVTGVADDPDVRYYTVQQLVGGARGRPTLHADVRVLHINELAQAIGQGGLFYVMRRHASRPVAALYRLGLRVAADGGWTLGVGCVDGAADAVALLPRFPFVREAHEDDIDGLQALARLEVDADDGPVTEASGRLIRQGWATRSDAGTRLTAIGTAILARY